MSATVPATAIAAAELDFQSEQVRQLYAGVPAGPAGGALAGILLTALLWERVDRPLLLTWIIGLLLVLLAGGVLGMAYQRSPVEQRDPHLWLQRFRLAVGTAGVTWGLASLLVFPSHDITSQSLFSVLLVGVAAGAVTAMAMDRVSALLFTAPLLVPLIVRLFIEDEGAFSAMVLVFLIYIGMSAFRHDQAARQNIQLRQAQTTHLHALRVALDSAQAANQAKSDFLASMSHELRTPLNAILGYSQLMEMRNDLPTDIMGNAHEIRHAGEHLLALVNDVLDLARIESGNIDLQLEAIPPAVLLAGCQSQHQRAAEARQIRLGFENLCAASAVWADRRRLLQVLNNLISNAIKYNREQGEVRVRCERTAAGIRFAVSDTGPGIPAAKQALLFQPFNRLGAEMGPIEGTGIGLVITRQLVTDMHGTMGLESEDGRGCTFWVVLPAALESKDDQPSERTTSIASSTRSTA